MTSFATPDQLAAALGVPAPTDPVIRTQWDTALADATGHLQSQIGQPVSAGTAVLDLTTDHRGEADVWLVPVTAITSITVDGVAVAADRWRLLDQRLYLPRPNTTYRVTVAYGYTEIPAELVRWTKVLAAAQLQVAPGGSLGLSNVSSVAVDDGKVAYTDGIAAALPDPVAQRLKATYGGPQ